MTPEYDHPRQFPRISNQSAVLVKKLGGDAVEDLAPTTNVGLGGCRFLSNEQLGVGSNLELLLSVDHQVVRSTARVVHERVLEDGRYEVGAEFLSLPEDDRHVIEKLFEKKS